MLAIMLCASCSAEVPPASRFCAMCGARVIPASVASAGEYRQLTVMFIDVVDSTPLSERLDPERLREVVEVYQAHVAPVVGRRGGTIAQYLGDGVLVYFGFPYAHEDDARRAILAGLDLVRSQAELNRRLEDSHGVRLQLRIGIHSGEVVVGELGGEGRREQLAVGMTVNVAARLSDVISPDVLVVSDATRRLAEADFLFEPFETLSLKGVSASIAAFRVVRERALVDQGGTPDGPHALIGRETELQQLVDAFHSAREGRGQVVVVSGEAGIGKSSLLRALRGRLVHDPLLWLEGRCSPFHASSALYPVAQIVEQALGIADEAPPTAKLERFRLRIGEVAPDDARGVALLAALLSLPAPERFALADLTPARLRSATLETVSRLLMGLAAKQPLVLVVEDLHWVDPSTLEVLGQLAESASRAAVMLLAAQRSATLPDWNVPFQEVRLGRLPPRETEALVGLQAGSKALPSPLRARIAAKSDGIPLFAEELTRMVLERTSAGSSGRAGDLGIPATLHGSLMARLDGLPLGKPVAQVAALLGRPFTVDLLTRISGLGEAQIRAGLDQLVEADLVRPIGEEADSRLAFKHSLVEDAAHRSLLRRDRRRIHGRIAEVLRQDHPEIIANQPEFVAHHDTEAGRIEDAVPMWIAAGHRAAATSAAVEAIRHYRRALELLETLDASKDRDLREIEVRLAMGTETITAEGYASETVEREFERITELCRRTEEEKGVFIALNGLWAYHLVRGDPEATEQRVWHLGELAARSKRPSQILAARHAEGATAFYAGHLARALSALADAADRHRAAFEERLAKGTRGRWRHTATSAPLYLGWCEHLMGQPARGLATQRDALSRAERLGDAYVRVEAMTHVVALLHDRREPEGALELSDRIVALCDDLGFRFWLGIARSARGWAQCQMGGATEREDGLAELREGLDIFRDTGAMVPLVYRVSYLAESLLVADRAEEGLAVVDDAFRRSRGRLDRFYDAELLRLRGELLRRAGADDAEVEQSLVGAIDLAASQGARLLELRATASLARAVAARGRREEAASRLGPLVAGWQEDSETPDLRDATALLTELGGS